MYYVKFYWAVSDYLTGECEKVIVGIVSEETYNNHKRDKFYCFEGPFSIDAPEIH